MHYLNISHALACTIAGPAQEGWLNLEESWSQGRSVSWLQPPTRTGLSQEPLLGTRAGNEDPRSFHNLCCSRRTTRWTVWADWRRRGTPTHTTTDTAATRHSTRTTSEKMVQRCYKQWCEWGDVDWLDRRCMMYQSKSTHTRAQVIYDDGDHYLSIISCYPFSRWTLDTAMIYGWRGNSLQLDA